MLNATVNDCFKLRLVHPHNWRQTKTRRFALQRARFNPGNKTLKYSAVESWSQTPLEIKINYMCRGVTTGWQGGHNSPGDESLRGTPKSINNVVSTFFTTVHVLLRR